MKKLVLLFLCCFPLVAYSVDEIEVKGLRLGMSESEAIAAFPSAECKKPQALSSFGDRVCYDRDNRYGGVKADIGFSFIEGKISSVYVSFDSKDFDVVASAMKEKYGRPARSETERLTTKKGAKLENHKYTWTNGKQWLTAREFTKELSKSAVHLSGKGAIEEFKRREQDEIKRRAQDL